MFTKYKIVWLAAASLCVIAVLLSVPRFIENNEVEPSSTPQSTQGTSAPPNTPTITICALRDHSIEVALKILRESDFEEKNGITVESVLLEFEPMVRAHEIEFSTNAGNYDLVSIDQPSLGRYATNQWVRSLDEFTGEASLPSLDIEDVVPVLRNACGIWDNKVFAIPLGSYGALFAYRKDVFEKNGWGPPKTFADFMDYAEKANNPPHLYGTALFAHAGEYITADAAPFLWSWGAGLINGCDVNFPDKPKFRVSWDTPEGIAALEFYARFFQNGLTPANTLEFDHARYIGAFQSGKVTMGIMPAEGVGAPMEDTSVSNVAGKIAYATLPGRKMPDGSVSAPNAGLGAHSLAISQGSKNPRQAFLVLQFLTSKQIGSEYIRRGGRPFRDSHFSDEAMEKDPYLKAIRDGMATGRCRPNIPEYPAVSKVFFTAFHSALKHNAPIAEVMRAAAKKANEEILIPAYPSVPKALPSGDPSEELH